jgi:hypothetical protein
LQQSVNRLRTKNGDKARDREMQQTKKGNQWYFGMKAHFGVDSRTKLIYAVVATPANVADSTVLPDLLHGQEPRVWGDQASRGQWAAIRQHVPEAQDFVNRRCRHAVSRMRSSGRKIGPSPKCGPRSNIRSGHQAGVRFCQGALSRAEEEHSSPARDLRAGQSIHRAPASAALRTGLVCPQPRRQTVQTPQGGTKTTQLPRSVAGEEIEMLAIHAPALYSDVP